MRKKRARTKSRLAGPRGIDQQGRYDGDLSDTLSPTPSDGYYKEPNTAVPAMSGQFISLADTGTLDRVAEAIQTAQKLLVRRKRIEDKLKACNHEAELFYLHKQWRKKNKNFSMELNNLTRSLEKRKSATVSELSRVRTEISRLAPNLVRFADEIVTPNSSAVVTPTYVRSGSRELADRDAFIHKVSDKTTLEICQALDFHFPPSAEAPSAVLPKTWYTEHKVTTFVEAYHHPKCKNKVQKLVSVARSRKKLT